MKTRLFAMLTIASFITACQGFKYHDPKKAYRGENQFYNNYDNSPKPSFWKWQWERWTKSAVEEPPFDPEVLKTDTVYLKKNKAENTMTWIGHSSVLLQTQGLNILIDPVFANRVSPLGFMGPQRQVALPFEISDLPLIDAVVISHSHYDHLDVESLQKIDMHSGGLTLFLVPLGSQDLLESVGIKNIKELDWWEKVSLGETQVTFTPAQHWTQRTPFDRNQSLWGGWHVQNQSLKFLYTGDTGYSKDFADIREKLGAVDVAMIPIGAYEPRWFMKQQHVNPDEAIQIHRDIGSKLSIGVHWGTFRLADEPLAAPAIDLASAIEKEKISSEAFRTMKHGETLRLD